MRAKRRISTEEIVIAIFFSTVLAILTFLYTQFGVTVWLLVILAGLFAFGILAAVLSEMHLRRLRKRRAKTR